MFLRISDKINEIGADEVGRGPGAGPVVAAAVLLPPDWNDARIRDSKKLSEKVRKDMDSEIRRFALAIGIGEASPEEVDSLNILNATFLAMERALQEIEKQGILIEHLVIDGNSFKTHRNVPYDTLVKGDDKHLSVAAASIIAKVHRDNLMQKLHEQFPQYGWKTNMGYLSKAHIDAIKSQGITPYHRMSFVRKFI